MSVWPTLVTRPIWIPFGIDGRELAGAPARGDHLVSEPDDVPLADAVEDERLTGSARVAHDPFRAGPDVDRRRRSLLVGEELDARGVRGHPRHEPDEAVRIHDGVEHLNSVVRARGDDDGLREGEAGTADDLGRRSDRSRSESAGRRCSRAASEGTRSPGARTRSGRRAGGGRAPPRGAGQPPSAQ